MYYTPETLLNHVFEDLRKPKAPNTAIGTHIQETALGARKRSAPDFFAKIRTLVISASFSTRAETHLHVFDAP
jgi:hypothetical protein